MKLFARSLVLAVASAGLVGLVGCGEDNESAAGGGQGITKPANAPTPEEYNKMMSKNAGQVGAGAGSNIPGTPPPTPTP